VPHDLELMSAQIAEIYQRVEAIEKTSLRDEKSARDTRNTIIGGIDNLTKGLVHMDHKFDRRMDTMELSLKDLEPVRVSTKRKEQLRQAWRLIWCRLKPARLKVTLAITFLYGAYAIEWAQLKASLLMLLTS
jgi:hypothetical protein